MTDNAASTEPADSDDATAAALQHRVEMEAMVASISNKLIATSAESVDQAINEALEMIGRFSDNDRCFLFQFSEDDRTATCTHEWVATGETKTIERLREVPVDEWLRSRLLTHEVTQFRDLNEMPDEASEIRAFMQSMNRKSGICVPMFDHDRLRGVLGFTATHEMRNWSQEDERLLVLAAETFMSALARGRVETELKRANENLEHEVTERTSQLTDVLREVETLKNRLQQENIYLQDEIKSDHNFEEIIGRSAALKAVLRKVEQVASTDATVLILGETGTGKELIARAVHDMSGRRARALVKVNCAALPETLIESELFGHEKGAFTGATAQRAGRFELADRGTIFLDEMGDMPLPLQAKLLRVLQEGEFERLGGTRTLKVNVRVIAATNRDLYKMVQDHEFREDLYYRISVFPLILPPLRERSGDLPPLVKNFAERFARKMGRKIERVPSPVMERLEAYSWPGNVRELQNVIERAVILSPGADLVIEESLTPTRPPAPRSALFTLEEVERRHILRVLEEVAWKITGTDGAAERLDMNPSTLRSRMAKLGIRRP